MGLFIFPLFTSLCCRRVAFDINASFQYFSVMLKGEIHSSSPSSCMIPKAAATPPPPTPAEAVPERAGGRGKGGALLPHSKYLADASMSVVNFNSQCSPVSELRYSFVFSDLETLQRPREVKSGFPQATKWQR